MLQPFKGISRGTASRSKANSPSNPISLHDFRLALGERSLAVKGRVVRCAISDADQDVVLYRSGIEFVALPARVHTVIGEFIEGVKSGRQAL
jgi:hypothetical protein